jgi:glycosyltransferase 2 family protein
MRGHSTVVPAILNDMIAASPATLVKTMAASQAHPATGLRQAKRLLPWVAKLAVSAALIWYLLAKIDVASAFARASSLPLTSVAGAFALILAQAVLGAIRWKVVIAAIKERLAAGKAVLITFVSLFFNQFLPASIGADVVRMWQSNRAGLPLPTAITSVMLERFGNLLCVVAMALALLPLWSRHAQTEGTRIAFMLLGIAGLAGLVLLMFLDRLPSGWQRWRIVRGFAALARDTRALFLTPRSAILLALTSLAGQSALAGAVLLLALGLRLDVGFIDCLVLMPSVVVVSSLPISVAGWGVRELAMVTDFGMLSVPADSALALSVVLALTGTAVSLPGGVIWLFSMADRSRATAAMPTGRPPK